MSTRNYMLEGQLQEAARVAGALEAAIQDFALDAQSFRVTKAEEIPAWIEKSKTEYPHRWKPGGSDDDDQLFADAFGETPNYTAQGRVVAKYGEVGAREIASRFNTKLGGKGGTTPVLCATS